MRFPLRKGSVREGTLTCYWHHARFDLCSGGTFDLFADDVRVYPVEVRIAHALLKSGQPYRAPLAPAASS